MSKQCWNICCVCWDNNDSTGNNCGADDINPGVCRSSDIDLRSILDLTKELYVPKKASSILNKLYEMKQEIKTKLPANDTEKLKDIISEIIKDLSTKDFIV